MTENTNNERTYAPSWVDRLTAWVERLPGPNWSYYLGLGLFLILVQVIVLWAEGASPISEYMTVYGFLALVISFFLALFHYLDQRAGAALTALRPALQASDQEYHELHYRLTTLPARSTLLVGLVALGLVFLTGIGTYQSETMSEFPIANSLLQILYLICWWIFITFMRHTVHQLRLINRIYTQHISINLFRLPPLYAFSNLSALTAASITVVPYGWTVIHYSDLDINDPSFWVWVPGIILLAIITFIWPQMGIHRLQVNEKDRLLNEAKKRLEVIILELHQRVDEAELEKMDNVYKTISSLQMEIKTLEGIPTWPWEPEAVRLLITALALPLGLWVVQYVLQQVLAG